MLRTEIKVKGQLSENWSEWFDGLTISHSGPDETVLTGLMPDQAALYGVISRLRDLGLELASVDCQQTKENSHERKD